MKTVRKDLKRRLLTIAEILSVSAFIVTAYLHNTQGSFSIAAPMAFSVIVVILSCYELFNKTPIKH